MRALTLLLLTLPFPALAGSSSRDCETAGKSIVMGAGNSSNRVQIKFIDKDGKAGEYDVPVKIMPEFDYNTEETAQTISAIPVSVEKILSRNHEHMHVVHKDGTECDGREAWDDLSVQTYVLTGKDGASLNRTDALYEKKVRGMNKDGYVVAEFRCRSHGVSTAGGCYADEGDKVTWEKDK